jgi:phosphoenolpyruvate carboxykinase (GTP)
MTDTLDRTPTPATAPPGSAQPPPAANPDVRLWVKQMADLCQSDAVRWLDGSDTERRALIELGLADGTFIRLNHQKLPNCYLHRSAPNDVARSEHQTYICTPSADIARFQ